MSGKNVIVYGTGNKRNAGAAERGGGQGAIPPPARRQERGRDGKWEGKGKKKKEGLKEKKSK